MSILQKQNKQKNAVVYKTNTAPDNEEFGSLAISHTVIFPFSVKML